MNALNRWHSITPCAKMVWITLAILFVLYGYTVAHSIVWSVVWIIVHIAQSLGVK